MRVLLVEPNYKNKYPPMGLMKISTYHKMLGDEVRFVKGVDPNVDAAVWDRIYITTLFTFDFSISAETILHYMRPVSYTHLDFSKKFRRRRNNLCALLQIALSTFQRTK